MKSLFYTKALIVLAVAIAAAAANSSPAQEQPMPPPANDAALPPNISPGSPVAQVVKLVQSGVDANLIKTFIANSGSNFNLDAETIVSLTDLGVPADLVNAMMAHDRAVPVVPAAPPAPAPAPVDNTSTAPPPTEVTVNYFNDTLTPYGSWVDVEGYGRCWRPTVVIYDATWRPYCDRGHWVYSDCGWYWASDYSWGATFHYGRWFRHAHYGWCWYPDTVWAPSWVTWRSCDEYYGWAPLPPFAVYQPGIGFYYRGASVAVGFSFGLDADCFTFVPPGHFYDHRPRYYAVEPRRVSEFFHRTAVVNNFNEHNRTVFNGGIPVERINTVGRRPIQPVPVGEIPNAARHGWRGNDADHRSGAGSPGDNGGRSLPPGNSQPGRGPVIRHDQNNDLRSGHPTPPGGSQPAPNRNLNQTPSVPPASSGQPGGHSSFRQEVNPPASNNPKPAPGTPVDHNQRRPDPQTSTGTHGSPPVNSVSPFHTQPVATSPVVGVPVNSRPVSSAPINRDQSRNYSGESPQHFNAPVAATLPPHSPPQVPATVNAPRQYAAPSTPAMTERPQSQRSEPRQNPVVTAPRNVTPPAPPVQPSAPAQSQSHSGSGSSDKNNQNH